MSRPKSLGRRLSQRLSIFARRMGRMLRIRSHRHRTDALEDPSSAITFGNRIIFYGIGLFLVWATIVPLDEGIPATGTITVESMRKAVSNFTGGSISIVHVRENQLVQANDPLITLDNTKTQATYNMAIHEYIAASAKLARLTAEQTSADRIQFPDELLFYAGQIGRRDYLTTQEQLFRIRRQTFQSEQSILRENLAASHGQITGAREQLAARSHQASLLNHEIKEIRPLVEAGYTARSNLLAQERQLAELNSVISELQAKVVRETGAGSEIRLRILQRQQEFLRDVETQIADTEREVANLRERISEARRDLDKTVIRAPVSGQVVGLQAQTPGAAITPGSRILDIVPTGEKLLIDAQIPTNLINRIVPGLTTQVQISSFTETPSLVIEGTVQSVSSDQHTPSNGAPYYLARIEITPKGLTELQGRQLRPGMPVSVVIKTGERSLLVYLMRPLLKRTFTALQEP